MLISDFHKDAFLKILTVTVIELKLGLLQKINKNVEFNTINKPDLEDI